MDCCPSLFQAHPAVGVVRPAQLVNHGFREALEGVISSTTYGSIFSADPLQWKQMSDRLFAEQSRALFGITECGSVLVVQPAASRGSQASDGMIQLDDLIKKICGSISFCCEILDLDVVDSLKRMTHVVPVARLSGDAPRVWSTGKGTMAQASNDHILMDIAYNDPKAILRVGLRQDTEHIAQDFAVLLRRYDDINPDLAG